MKITIALSVLLLGASSGQPESKPTAAQAPASMPAAPTGKAMTLHSGAKVTIPDGGKPAGPTAIFLPASNALLDVRETLTPDCADFLQKEYAAASASAKDASSPTHLTKVEWRQVAGEKALAAEGTTKSKDGSVHPIATVATCHGKSSLTVVVSQKSGETLDAAGRGVLDGVVASIVFPAK